MSTQDRGSRLKSAVQRVIPKGLPLRVKPVLREPRAVAAITPPRVDGGGKNPRQGTRRDMDLHVAWSLTVRRSPRVGAELFIRGRRSTRRGGDRYHGGRGGQQKRGVVHSDSHGDVPFASTCFSARRGVDADAPESEWRDRRPQAMASCTISAAAVAMEAITVTSVERTARATRILRNGGVISQPSRYRRPMSSTLTPNGVARHLQDVSYRLAVVVDYGWR